MRLFAFLLIAEGVWSAFWIAGLLPALGVYPNTVLVIVVLRAVLAALACSSGWWLATGRAVGAVFAPWTLLGSAVLTTFEVGWRMAPSDLWPWYRWYYVSGYWVYAAAAGWYIYRQGLKFEVRSRK